MGVEGKSHYMSKQILIYHGKYEACEPVDMMLPREKTSPLGGAGLYSGLSTSPW